MHILFLCLSSGIYYNHHQFGDGNQHTRAKCLPVPGQPNDCIDIIDMHTTDTNQHKNGGYCNDNNHGTHVAALAGGLEYGIARKATLYSVRVADCNGKSKIGYIMEGLYHVVKHIKHTQKPSVINLSLSGGRGFISAAGNAAIRRVVNEEHIPVVVSAGNDAFEASRYWPAIPDVINVGATKYDDAQVNDKDQLYVNSNYGPAIDIFAPGHDIESASIPTNANDNSRTRTATKSGTSMAAAVVSGVVAALLEEDSTLTPAALKKKLLTDHAFDSVIKGNVQGIPFNDKNSPNKLLKAKLNAN